MTSCSRSPYHVASRLRFACAGWHFRNLLSPIPRIFTARARYWCILRQGGSMLLLLIFLLFPCAVWAQAVSGTIYGVVRDPSEAAVAGATVTARNVNTNYMRTAVTT